MSLKTLKISEDTMEKIGVSSLPTRPNAPVTSGGQGFSPSAMRARFDALPRHIAGQFNALIDKLTSANGEYSITALQGLVNGLDGDIDKINEEIKNLVSQSPDGIREELEKIKEAQQKRDGAQDEKSASIEKILTDYKLDLENFKATLADSVAEVEDSYSTRITADGLNIYDEQNTFVKRIDGATEKSSNILPYPYVDGSQTQNGLTITVLPDGGIHLEGELEDDGTFVLANSSTPVKLESGKMYFFGAKRVGNVDVSSFAYFNTGNYVLTNEFIEIADGETVETFAITMNKITGTDYHFNGTVYPMIVEVEGYTSVIPDYQPYAKGLVNARMSKIVSGGRQLVSSPYASGNTVFGETYVTDLGDDGIKFNGSHSGDIEYYLFKDRFFRAGTYTVNLDGSDGSLYCVFEYRHKDGYIARDGRMTLEKDGYVSCCILQDSFMTVYDNLVVYPMVANSKSFLPYEPHIEDTYQLPHTVELGKWDYIDVEAGKIYRYTKTLTQEDIENGEVGNTSTNLFYLSLPVLPSNERIGISSGFNVVHYPYPSDLPEDGEAVITTGALFARIALGSVDEFREYLASVDTSYKTAEPISVEDIDIPKSYKAWNGGTETVIGEGDAMNAHANPTITQEYLVKGAI